MKVPEPFPSEKDECSINISTNDDFFKILGIESTKPAPQKELSDNTASQKAYPAYAQLITSLCKWSRQGNTSMHILISYLHSKQKIVTKNSLHNSYNDLKRIFYDKAHNLLFIKKICNQYNQGSNDLYDLLEIVDQIKTNHKKQEMDLGYDILMFKDTEQDVLQILNYLIIGVNYYDIDKRNPISLFCKLIKKYNDDQHNKITPTDEQCFCYQLYKNLDFTLPDSFDSTLFDENKYAFTELLTLFDNIVKLKQYSDANVQIFVDKLYAKKD